MSKPDLTETRLGTLLTEVRGLRGDLRLLTGLVRRAVELQERRVRPAILTPARQPDDEVVLLEAD